MRAPPRIPLVIRALVVVVAASVVVASCGGASQEAPSGSQVVVELSDYKVTVNVASVKAGSVKIGVRNVANMEHSFQVIKTDLAPDKLPVDGVTAKAKEDGKVGEIPSIPAGKSAAVTIAFTPGNYVFICNGSGHYQLGMHTGFTVEAP